MEQLKDTDALTQALKELAGDFPSLLRPLIHERDEFMVARLRSMAVTPGVEKVVATNSLSAESGGSASSAS